MSKKNRRIALVAHGTRGDVQPFLALGHELEKRGHAVHLGVPPNLLDFAKRSGLSCSALAGDSQAIMESEQGRRWLSSGNVGAFFKEMAGIYKEIGRDLAHRTIEACEGADVVVGNIMSDDWTRAVAEKRGIPHVLAYTFPLLPTREYPNFMVSTGYVPFAALRGFTHTLFHREAWKSRAEAVGYLRGVLGLGPQSTTTSMLAAKEKVTALNLWSPTLLPRPADWHEGAHVTGHLRLPSELRARLGEGEPPAALVDWLRAGEAPVYLGFGSMPIMDPKAALERAVLVGRQLGVRVLIGAGWSAMKELSEGLPPGAFLVNQVNHEWLFPQCAAAVHHGGAGTTAAALEAGLPSMVCSVFADQPFWGARVEAAGVGVHVPYAKLEEDKLRKGIAALLEPARREKARALGATLSREQGNAVAVEHFERALETVA